MILCIWQLVRLFVLLLKATCKNNHIYFTDIKEPQKHVPRMIFFFQELHIRAIAV